MTQTISIVMWRNGITINNLQNNESHKAEKEHDDKHYRRLRLDKYIVLIRV